MTMHVPTMSLREFDDAQSGMPSGGLASRTQRLRASATRAWMCACCGVGRRLLWLCFAAVRHGDDAIAEMLLTEAEHYIGTGKHHPNCPQGPRPAARGVRAPMQGRAPGWDGHPGVLVAATDASWKRGTCGLGYVISDGRWGMHGWTFGPQDPTGPRKVLVSELRAVDLLLGRVEDGPELTLLVDSLSALRLLRAWRRGDTTLMPDGYDLRPRRSGPPALVRLARRVARRPGLRLEHVKGHSGHPLNETADSLASIARRRVTENFDSRTRAEGLVEAFLRAWHDGDHGEIAA